MRISEQPHLLTLAKELLSVHELTRPSAALEYNFKQPVGNTDIVETSPTDVIVYAKLLRQPTYTRFVKKRQMLPSSYVSLVLHRDEDGEYELDDVWFGKQVPPLPGDQHETAASKEYWQSHAIVLSSQTLQPRSATHDWPFDDEA